MESKFRQMFIENFNKLLKQVPETGTKTAVYTVEVCMLQDLLKVFTGTEEINEFHDFCCSVIEKAHREFEM